MTELHKKIKLLRKENNMTQDDLARALGISRPTIAGYESNKRKPDINTLIKIAKFFNVSIDYLLDQTNQRTSNYKLENAFSSDPELLDFWDVFLDNKKLQNLFKLTKDLSKKDIEWIIEIIRTIEKKNK